MFSPTVSQLNPHRKIITTSNKATATTTEKVIILQLQTKAVNYFWKVLSKYVMHLYRLLDAEWGYENTIYISPILRPFATYWTLTVAIKHSNKQSKLRWFVNLCHYNKDSK